MENKIANFLKAGTLLLGFSLLLWNCEESEVLNLDNTKRISYTLKKISYDELIRDREIKKSLKLIKGKFSKNKQKYSYKNSTEIAEGFTILTEEINRVESGDIITWAFKINTPVLKSSYFENFLVKKQNEKFYYFLVSYEKYSEKEYKDAILYPISQEKLNLDNLNFTSRGESFMDEGEGGGGGGTGTGCQGNITVYPCDNGNTYIHGPESYTDGSFCTGTTSIIDFSHCPSGSTGDPNNPINTTTPDSGDTSTGGISSGGSTITSPVTFECDGCTSSLISQLNITDQNQIDWVNDPANSSEVAVLFNFNSTNNTPDAKTFAQQVIKAMANNTDLDLSPYLNSITATPSGTSFQDYDPNDPILGNQILLDIVNNAIDGFGNLILIYLEYKSSNSNEGKILRVLMPKMGLEIPADVPDETLGELFSLRKRDRSLVVEYQDNTLKGLIIDVAVSAFDVVALISPSRGGGAYLLATGGNRVTAVALSNLLKSLKNNIYSLRGPMIGKRIGHTYKVHGSHVTEFCKMRAINGNKAIGQWLDDAAVESFIARHLSQLSNGTRDIPIPQSLQNIGRVFRKGDGTIFTPTHIRLVPSGSGVYTAYPVNSTLSTLGRIGVYVP